MGVGAMVVELDREFGDGDVGNGKDRGNRVLDSIMERFESQSIESLVSP